MKKRFTINVLRKKFTLGKYVFDDGKTYILESNFNHAVDELKNGEHGIKSGNVYLYAADEIVPYLNMKMQKDLVKDNRIGKVLAFDYDKWTIGVEIDDKKYGCSKMFEIFFSKYGANNMVCDVETIGTNFNEGSATRFNIDAIVKFELYINRDSLVDYAKQTLHPDDIVELKIPMYTKPDKDGKYYIAGKPLYYTKKDVEEAIDDEYFKTAISEGLLPLVIGQIPFPYYDIPITSVGGSVIEYNKDEDYIVIKVNKNNIHGDMLIRNKDLIGKELFAGFMMSAQPRKSKIVLADGTNTDTDELEIAKIFAFQLIRDRTRNPDNNKETNDTAEDNK